MCGIAGFFQRNGGLSPPFVINSMADSLKHRGPDGSGVFIDGCFSLAHRRLSIIDIEGGSQPMTNEDGSIVIVFNGEIYNYKELREALLSRGHRFCSHSDTEVMLHLYEEKGMELFTELNGMFAVAIADLRHKRLLLARDRLGKKPLFYHEDAKLVVFASELKAIVLHPDVPKELDSLSLYEYLSLNYVPGAGTMMKNIRRVPQGTAILFSQTGRREVKFWDLSTFRNSQRNDISEQEAIEELDALLTDSIRLRLRSDVPVGIFLSGGVDSSLIAWKAMELGADLCGYTASFREQSYSEAKYAAQTAETIGMNHKVFEISLDVEDVFDKIVYHADDPCADSSALPVYFLSRNTSQHVKVVLGGDGGDELFAGYLTYPATLLAGRVRRYLPVGVAGTLRYMAGWLPISDRKVALEYKIKRFLRGLELPPGAAHFSWNGTWCGLEKDQLLTKEFLSSVCPLRDTYAALMDRYHIDPANPSLLNLQEADICEYLPNDILAKVDRMSMAHGLEVRSPWLDSRIAAWALTIPPSLKLGRGRIGKYLLKRYMRQKFPAPLANRPKQGFSIPIHKWIRERLWGLVEELLSEKALKESGIFHSKNIWDMLLKHREKKASFGFEIWGLLVFMAWRKHFLVV